MQPLEIAPEGTHFVRAGRPFPLILDTGWATFADSGGLVVDRLDTPGDAVLFLERR